MEMDANENDHWRLPHDSIFLQSGPISVLTVYSHERYPAVPRLLRDFDVAVIDPQPGRPWHHFQSRRLVDGEHKVQALTLFALGSVLLHLDPCVSLYLHECRRLPAHLESRLVHGSLEPPRYWLQDLDAWNSTPGSFAIDEATQLHLRMAGLLVTTRSKICCLSRQAISSLVARQLEAVRSERTPREQAA